MHNGHNKGCDVVLVSYMGALSIRKAKMCYKYEKYVTCGIQITLLLCIFLLAACGAGDNTQTGANKAMATPTQGTASSTQPVVIPTQGKITSGGTNTAAVTVTPIQSNGAAPIEIATPTQVSGGSSSSEQVVLKDRTLIIESVSKQKGANSDPVAINIAVTIKNTGGKAIQNQASFFHLVGTGGDFFGQTNSSDNFYGSIAAHTTRSGTITFQLPAAAATNLRLMYRPEVASGALLIPLKL
jgi:hypothetical protein